MLVLFRDFETVVLTALCLPQHFILVDKFTVFHSLKSKMVCVYIIKNRFKIKAVHK